VITEEIWVNTAEGAEITGYNQEYLKKLAHRISKQPVDERLIKIRLRSNRYELWLPDLITYMTEHGYGPHTTPDKQLDNIPNTG
jgi:hypothetical protein